MTCHACHREAKHLFYFTLLCGCKHKKELQ